MFDFEARSYSTHIEVILRGDLDFSTETRAREFLAALFVEHPTQIILDVTGLTFLGGGGACFLLWSAREAAARGCSLAVVSGGNRWVHRVLTLLRWEEEVPLYLTREVALLSRTEGAEAGGAFCHRPTDRGWREGAPNPTPAEGKPEHGAAGARPETPNLIPIRPPAAERPAPAPAVATLDAEGRIDSVNPALERLLGIPRRRLLGRPLAEFVEAGARRRLPERLRRAVRGHSELCILRLRRGDGTSQAVLLALEPTRWRCSHAPGAVGLFLRPHERG